MPNLRALVKEAGWGLRHAPPETVLLTFTSLTHASVDTYELEYRDQADASVGATNTFTANSLAFDDPVVTIYLEWANLAGLVNGTTYDLLLRDARTIGGVIVHGPWSDTGYDYTA